MENDETGKNENENGTGEAWELVHQDEVEVYEANGRFWNVTKAKVMMLHLSEKRPEAFGVASIRNARIDLESHRQNHPDVDEAYALALTGDALNIPTIWVPAGTNMHTCIDGHHRIRRALLLEIDTIDLCLFTEEESTEVAFKATDPDGVTKEALEELFTISEFIVGEVMHEPQA